MSISWYIVYEIHNLCHFHAFPPANSELSHIVFWDKLAVTKCICTLVILHLYVHMVLRLWGFLICCDGLIQLPSRQTITLPMQQKKYNGKNSPNFEYFHISVWFVCYFYICNFVEKRQYFQKKNTTDYISYDIMNVGTWAKLRTYKDSPYSIITC